MQYPGTGLRPVRQELTVIGLVPSRRAKSLPYQPRTRRASVKNSRRSLGLEGMLLPFREPPRLDRISSLPFQGRRSRGKYLSLEEARRKKQLDCFCKEHPSSADERRFWALMEAMI